MSRRIGSFLHFALPLLAACQAYPPPPEQGQAQDRAGVTSERVLSEVYSGIDQPRRLVIREADVWHEFWDEAMGQRTPVPSAPEIDFESQMIVAAAMGRRGTGGYSIDITDVSRAGNALTATVVETSPGPDCMLTQAFTAPVVAVSVPRTDGPVEYVERAETQACG